MCLWAAYAKKLIFVLGSWQRTLNAFFIAILMYRECMYVCSLSKNKVKENFLPLSDIFACIFIYFFLSIRNHFVLIVV